MRLVPDGFWQWLGINFDKTSALLVSIAAVCLTLDVLEGVGMTLKNLDVTRTFLESKNNEEIYVTLLKGIVHLEGCLRVGCDRKVSVRVLKSLSGIKQASLNWFETLKNFVTSTGMQGLKAEPDIHELLETENQGREVV